eukprot:Ihof_evm1s665 gene=Ihof_evmTU1s665
MTRRPTIKERVEVPSSSSEEDLPLVIQYREIQIVERERRLLSKHQPKTVKGH